MSIDTSEKGLKTFIMCHMTDVDGLAVAPNMVSISRLVADVVTGKIEVREAAARLPEVSTDTAAELAAKTLDGAGNLDETEAEEM